ncbi:15-hydroxyprostaglandin dehydrogenase [NAD(+)] [Halyomorpha halys]|uniref:15-hydroxyprostaglandin dehydrogenase [NAD(+)] n=1 Tax=Halyomorpha halys TaxID=286706 RepID=UPI0006D507D0|nr:15-hydroxyprostaglandin dehydrogenase [NAD(+)] [Halyomorpha halys]
MASSEPNQLLDVKGKVALVTGGATGIGLAMADALLSEGLKKAYISGNIDKDGEEAVREITKKHGEGRCTYKHLDVTSMEQFEDVFNEIISIEGGIDILLNNAGIVNEKKWELQTDVNINGVMRGCHLALKYMANRNACVVNTSSIACFDPAPYLPGYSASKFAITGLSRAFGDPILSKESNIRFMVVAPGATKTGIGNITPSSYHFNEEWGRLNLERFISAQDQGPEAVAKGTVYIIKYGTSGSVWVVEHNQLLRVTYPKRESYQTKIIDL